METIQRVAIGARPSLVPLVEAHTHAFMITHHRAPEHHFLWHYHPETELVWGRQGDGLRFVGRSAEPFEAGDLVLLGGGLPHTWVSAPEMATEAVWTVVHFQPDRWGEAFWQLPELRKVRALLVESGRGLRFTGPERWEIGQAVEDLAALPPYSLEGLVEFLAIFQRLAHAPHQPLDPMPARERPPSGDVRLRQILGWVQHRAAEPITQEQAALEAGMSPAAFSRWFKAQVGCVFHRYLNEVRVAMVCARLAAGPASITEVAFECGYGTLANFNRRFREITGLTPRQFRGLSLQSQQESARTSIMRLGRYNSVRIQSAFPAQ